MNLGAIPLCTGVFMNKYFKVALAVGALAAAGSASAATATGNLAVSATVATNCLFNSGTMAFGTYTPGSGNLDVNGSVIVRCTNGLTYAVGLGAGLATGATEANRSMQNGAALLSYQLFRDTRRIAELGPGPGWRPGCRYRCWPGNRPDAHGLRTYSGFGSQPAGRRWQIRGHGSRDHQLLKH